MVSRVHSRVWQLHTNHDVDDLLLTLMTCNTNSITTYHTVYVLQYSMHRPGSYSLRSHARFQRQPRLTLLADSCCHS
jgi:hypothetical protein